MTAKQKANRERFKSAIAEAAKIRAKNPKLTQAEAVKKAWAIIYTNKKPAKKVGALPLGFRGNIWGVDFKIVNQFDIYGEVNAIAENTKTGQKIVTFDGKESAKNLSEKFLTHVLNNRTFINYIDKELNELKKRIFAFCVNMQKEVKEYNAGKKSTIKKQTLKIEKPKKSAKTTEVFNPYMPDVDYSKRVKTAAKKAVKNTGKKHTKWKTVAEHKRRVAGTHKDTKSHNVNIRVMSGIKLSNEEIKFLESESKNSTGYNYRAKIIFGQECVLKETKIGTPVKKWSVDNMEIAKYLADELNKNKKYKKIKSGKI